MLNLLYLFFILVIGAFSLSLIMCCTLAFLGVKRVKLSKIEVLFMRYSKNLFLMLVIGLFFYMMLPGGLITEKTKFFAQKSICRSVEYPGTVINNTHTLYNGFLYHGFYTTDIIDTVFTKEYTELNAEPCGPSFGIDYTGFGTFKSNLCPGSDLYPFYKLDVIFVFGMIIYCIVFLFSVRPTEYNTFDVIKIRAGYLLFFLLAFFILSFSNFYGGIVLVTEPYCLSRDYSFFYFDVGESCLYDSVNTSLNCESYGDDINGDEH